MANPTVDNGGLTDYPVASDDDGSGNNVQLVKLVQAADAQRAAIAADGSGLEVQLGAALPAGTNNIGDVDVASSALPTGAATLAEQQTQTTALQLIDDAVYTDGSGTPSKAIGIAGTDGTNPQIVKTDASGELQVDVLTSALPSGAATSAKQDTVIGHLDGVEGLLTTIDTDTGTIAGAVSGTEVQVDVVGALPAGNNNIGDIDVASVPADPFGANADAAVAAGAAGSIQAKLRRLSSDLDAVKTAVETLDNAISGSEMQVDVVGALPAGNNNIGDVDVASSALPTGAATAANQSTAITALQLIDDIVKTDDAAFAVGTDEVAMAGFLVDETSTDSADEGDAAAARLTANRQQIVTVRPNASGEGLDIFRTLDADETEEEIKASAGKIYGWFIYNDGAAEVYVKFYNATAANVTVGTTTPVLTIPIPAGSAANVEFTNGIPFSTAICIAATTAVADNDTTAPAANQVVANIFYK